MGSVVLSYADDAKALGLLQRGIGGKTMVIQGLGNVGSYSGMISQTEGDVKVIGTEMEGTIYSEKGINIEKLVKYRKDKGSILGFPGTKTLPDREDWVAIECDILVPAALENQIHTGNAKKVKAKIIAEAANGP